MTKISVTDKTVTREELLAAEEDDDLAQPAA